MDEPLDKERVVPQLWAAYRKTPEYKGGERYAIPAHHPSVIKQEREGLRSIYATFINTFLMRRDVGRELVRRPVGDWLDQWKQMHRLLFHRILRECGQWRTHDIRFGAPGDEVLHRIPAHSEVPRAVNELAYWISQELAKTRSTDQEKFRLLATVHYQFVRIHPFPDGNGRIARAITDQIAILFGYPPAMAGYPRHRKEQRSIYHRAIKACIEDPNCAELARWIQNYIERSIAQAA